MGFDRVYPPGVKIEKALEDLKEDIGNWWNLIF
jgi:methylmalonyl-CoA mutase cobalamin-binding subunit